MRSLVLALMMVMLLTPSARALDGPAVFDSGLDKYGDPLGLPIGAGEDGPFVFVKPDLKPAETDPVTKVVTPKYYDGLVGINTGDPKFNLDVNGNVNITGTLYANELIVTGTSNLTEFELPDPVRVANLLVSDTATINTFITDDIMVINNSNSTGILNIGNTLFARQVRVKGWNKDNLWSEEYEVDDSDNNEILSENVAVADAVTAPYIEAIGTISTLWLVKYYYVGSKVVPSRILTARELNNAGCDGKRLKWISDGDYDGQLPDWCE